jgi:CheY-like chemotaxis protein
MVQETVLVVEDDFIQRRQIVRALLEEGYCTVEASEGLEAIRILFEQRIDLVLTDIKMPCLDGISLLKYIKIFYSGIPVVIATAYPQEIQDLRPDALLCKPFGTDELMTSVRRLIRHSNL